MLTTKTGSSAKRKARCISLAREMRNRTFCLEELKEKDKLEDIGIDIE
jgi:uncharacterized protein YjiS (DUF1127 family)